MKLIGLFALCGICLAAPNVYYKEEFDTDAWRDRWIESTFKGADQGKFGWTAGKFFNDEVKDKGLQTSQDAKFYGISAKFPKFSNEGKNLVIQFSAKHEQGIDCGGGYVKVFADDVDQIQFHGETPYSIMFGPDICGMTKKVHVILHYEGVNHLIKKEVRCKDDELTHLYTLILKPDNTYEVLIDLEKAESGTLEEDWDMLKPKKINDPNAKKPDDWTDNEKIDDPTDTKPEDWEKPKTIPDPKAKKPEDWDEEMDGEWEAAQIDNPEYKGEFKPKQIDNPSYKGQWVHPEIDNPDYKENSNLYMFKNLGGIGFDLWQVKAGTIFDNVLITDDVDYAKKFGEETWKVTAQGEKVKKEAADEIERKQRDKEDEERKKAEEAEKAKSDAEDKDKKPESKVTEEDNKDIDDEVKEKEEL